MNTVTDEQRKAALTALAFGTLLGGAITFIIMHIIYKKQVGKLEAKIFKLEGWQ